MTSVDDTIWAAITCDPQAPVALALEQPPPQRRRYRMVALAGSLCLAIATSAFLLQGGDDHAAYALAVQSDGTIILTLSELEGIEGANSQLARMGAPIRVVRLSATCTETGEPDRSATSVLSSIVEPAEGGSGAISWRIHPGAIPAGDTMLLEAKTLSNTSTLAGYHAMLYRGLGAPSCFPSGEAQ